MPFRGNAQCLKSSMFLFPITTDTARRNLSLRDTRFTLLSKRMLKVKNLEAVESMLLKNEENEIENSVIFEVLNRLPNLHTKHTERHLDKVRKLIRLNTYILAEQVRVFQQIRDGDLAMNLRFPYPILEDNSNQIIFNQLRSKPTKVPKRRSNFVKVEYPAPMDSILTASSVLNNSQESSSRMWRNPTLQSVECVSEPLPHMLVLDCNALKPHNDVTLPMGPKATFNPHKTIPPIIPKTLEEKRDSASFTLPVVETYSSADSGYEGSNVVLDPARYM